MPFPEDVNGAGTVLIVVGASLQAEVNDRPLAYRLREDILRWHEYQPDAGLVDAACYVRPVVCSDLWYLNNQPLLARPTIALGDPAVNAATAYLAPKLATAFVIQDAFRVHLDLDFLDLQACVWGVNPIATASAIDLFVERYLDGFLGAAVQIEQT